MKLSKQSLLGYTVIVVAPSVIVGMTYQTQRFSSMVRRLISSNPYAFHIRRQIYEALELCDEDVDDLENQEPKSRMQEIMKYGFPGLDDLRVYEDFVLSFDRRNRVAHWVYEHLRPESVAGGSTYNKYENRNYSGERPFSSLGNADNNGVLRQSAEFQSDMKVPSLFRVDINDYYRSGFDRGHLAAAGNHKGNSSAYRETFYLTNVTPQVGPGFNQDAWNNLEIYVRELTERYGSVYVCTGSLYLPKYQPNGRYCVEYEVIGSKTVAVPTHFFKIVIIESRTPGYRPYLEAYLMPNAYISKETDLRSFLVDVREIERLSGLEFNMNRSNFSGVNYRTEHELYDNFR